jgi:cytoskeletal protein CcmA (bactofilin family)
VSGWTTRLENLLRVQKWLPSRRSENQPGSPASVATTFQAVRYDASTSVSVGSIQDRSDTVVFRKESRHESFQRQISALRQQLNADSDEEQLDDEAPLSPIDMTPPPGAGWDEYSASQAPAAPTIREADPSTGVVAANSTWNGTLRSSGSIHIFGQVEGEINAENDVFVAEGAVVQAHVSALNVIVAGMVDGTIECGGRLEVLATGTVTGDMTSPALVVHEGATIDGDLKMRGPAPVAS